MKDNDRFFTLGKITRVKGVKGELEVLLDSDHPEKYKDLESVLLEMNSELVPFFISQIRIHGRQATIRLEGIENLDQALGLVDKPVILPIEQLPPLTGKKYYWHELMGSGVTDKTKGELGIIRNIYEVAGQPIASVMLDEKEILFPLREIFIDHFDREARKLFVNLPEGLVDLYRE